MLSKSPPTTEKDALEQPVFENPQDILMNAPVGIFTSTPDGRYLSANNTLARMHGYDSPRQLMDFVTDIATQIYADPADRNELKRLLEKHGEVTNFECRLRHRNGSTFWVSENISVLKDKDGNTIGYQGFNQDITERKQVEEAQQELEETISGIIDSSPFSIQLLDPAGYTLRTNPAFKLLFGTVPTADYSIFNDPNFDRSGPEYNLLMLFAKGERISFSELFYNTRRISSHLPDNPLWLRVEGFPLLDKAGNIKNLVLVHEDITKRKQAEESLRKSEERFSLAMQATRDGVWDWDVTTGAAYFSPGYSKMLGYDSTEVPPHVQTWLDLIHPEDRDKAYQANLDCINNLMHSFAVEFRMQAKNGDWVWILGRGSAAKRDDSGKALRMIGTHTDITRRKQAEEEIRLNKKRIETLQELTFMSDAGESELVHFAMEAAISLTSSAIGYVAFPDKDETTLTMYAWSSKAMQECAVKDKSLEYKLCKTGLWGEAVRQRRAVITNDYSSPTALNKGLPEGHVHIKRHMNVPVFDGDRIVIVAGVGNKQTEYRDDDVRQLALLMTGLWTILCRKRAEQEREKLQAQLLQAQKMESIGILAGGVAHDFNNLLQTMSGNLEMLLQDKSSDHPDFGRLQGISRSVDRSSQLVQQLLLAGRKAEFQKIQVDLNKELQEVCKVLERVIPKMIALELHLDPHIRPIAADPVQIEQVLLNLANNAVDAMPQGGRLAFETHNVVLDEAFVKMHPGADPGNHVLLSVTDTGSGMDRETLNHIFDPFFTTKETGKGSGLGLATAYGIVNAHGGYIHCYSEPGQGTTFKIFFPVQESDVLQPEKAVPPDNSPGGRETILVVDDEPEIRELTREVLESLGYAAMIASSGEEALDIYKQQGKNVDLVLLDLNMPGMGGDKCLQELLQLDPQVRVLIVSGYAFNALDILNAGSKGYLSKPYQTNELAAKLREVLDSD